MLCSRINFYFLHSTKETGLFSEQHNPWCIVSYGTVPGLWFPWCVLRAEVIRWHFAPWGRVLYWCFFSIQLPVFINFWPVQLHSTNRTGFPLFSSHTTVTSPMSPMFVCYSQFLPFPQSPTEKLPTCSLPLQHPPDFCPLQITKPINSHTHFLICRLALVFLSPPQTQPVLLHLQHTSTSYTLPLSVSYSNFTFLQCL